MSTFTPREAEQISTFTDEALRQGLSLADAIRAAKLTACWESAILRCEAAAKRCKVVQFRTRGVTW